MKSGRYFANFLTILSCFLYQAKTFITFFKHQKNYYIIFEQLIVSDPFPQFLCGPCATDLQSFHLLIEKAIESEQIFQKKWQIDFECIEEESVEYPMECAATDTDPKTEHIYIVDNSQENDSFISTFTENDNVTIECGLNSALAEEETKNTENTRDLLQAYAEHDNTVETIFETENDLSEFIDTEEQSLIRIEDKDEEEETEESKSVIGSNERDENDIGKKKPSGKRRRKREYKPLTRPLMCSFCGKSIYVYIYSFIYI